MKKKICVVTGSRAEYGILRPILFEITKTSDLQLSIIVTGMHLSPYFGYTIKDIEKDGFKPDTIVDMQLDSSGGLGMAKSIGIGIIGLAQALNEFKPDILLIVGDRIEALAATIAASYLNIPVAHIHGGDKSAGGHVDDNIRHAITKLAQIHFAATQESGDRIIKMGEDPSKVYVVGAPALDTILNEKLDVPKNILKKYSIDPTKPFIIIVQNPVSLEYEDAQDQMKEILKAITSLQVQSLVIYPNADMGGEKIIEAIHEYEKYPFIKTFQNVPHKDFLSLMRVAGAIVGNSSSALIEAPSFGLPAINVGSRQKGRERAQNVIDVPYSRIEIRDAINKALHDNEFRKKVKLSGSPYGDGHASERIVKILLDINISPELLKKKITY
jgi:UDP-N-acetylglucosamine 2-epimerase (non-hydrolysing)/GDP/UDP-N,N'-diacetylbacillosamine 2-epimerase (hydrolysing)